MKYYLTGMVLITVDYYYYYYSYYYFPLLFYNYCYSCNKTVLSTIKFINPTMLMSLYKSTIPFIKIL